MKILNFLIWLIFIVCLIGGFIDDTDPVVAFGRLSYAARTSFREGFNYEIEKELNNG